MKSSSHDIRKEIKDYIREGHINKDKLIDNLIDFLTRDELQDFVIIRDTIDKSYPEYRGRPIARFLDDVQMNTLSDDCYVDLDDSRNEHMVSDSDIDKMITIDEYYVGVNDNVGIVSMLNPKDGKIYRYADF